VIFRGGAKIIPAEVESVLQAHEAVLEAAVVGRASSGNEQELVAYVVAKRPVGSGEILAHCRNQLTAYKVPREIHLVPELPRTTSGKVDKRMLATKNE
jgi:acyl-coenzyme A synthetase/AMP-(fatty) acid ligase